jgi:hypothetical protein
MGKDMDIFCLSGMKYPIHILAPTFSTVSLEILKNEEAFRIGLGRSR